MSRRTHQYPTTQRPSPRRGAVVVWAAFLLVIFLGMVAFSIDVGYMQLARGELHRASDAASLAAAGSMFDGIGTAREKAKEYGAYHRSAAEEINIPDDDIEFGVWDDETRSFTETGSVANAVKVTTRREDANLFFGWIFGSQNFSAAATSIATIQHRDIVFVVDLSGSMNDDTEPAWATSVVNDEFASQGYPTIGSDLMQDIYTDFSYGTFPGTLEYIGAPLGVAADKWAYAEMTKNDGPLTADSVPAAYRIDNEDSEKDRKKKAYRWLIDVQIAAVMPDVKPAADSTVNYDYWEKYLDYIIDPERVKDPNPPPPPPPKPKPDPKPAPKPDPTPDPDPEPDPGPPPPPPPPPIGMKTIGDDGSWYAAFDARYGQTTRKPALRITNEPLALGPGLAWQTVLLSQMIAGAPGQPRKEYGKWLPPSQDGDRITSFNNPNKYTFPSADKNLPKKLRNFIGYLTYVQFMMDHGRDKKPIGGHFVPLSTQSPDCPYHLEETAGGTMQFPPREQPMHAARRSLIAALQVVKEHNYQITNPNSRDWVSIVTYDRLDKSSPTVAQALTGDYDEAMISCTKLQSVSDVGATTATESGLILARNHIKPASEGGKGRELAHKVVILLTDGVPNVYESSAADVDNYIAENPHADYHANGAYWFDAPIMQAAQMQSEKWDVYPVGIGLGTDYDFLDRIARIGETDEGGVSPRGSGNPAEYEQRLTEIFEDIMMNVRIRLAH